MSRPALVCPHNQVYVRMIMRGYHVSKENIFDVAIFSTEKDPNLRNSQNIEVLKKPTYTVVLDLTDNRTLSQYQSVWSFQQLIIIIIIIPYDTWFIQA